MKKNAHHFTAVSDLAIESAALPSSCKNSAPAGVLVETCEQNGICRTKVTIKTAEGSRAMGKPIGTYITIETQAMKAPEPEAHEKIIALVADSLRTLLHGDTEGLTLVVGLGNRYVTPDALGPKVIAKTLVTNHLRQTLAQELQDAVSAVAAISPGVMGLTGMETAEVLAGIVQEIRPQRLIAIDALAARKTTRINAAIQLSDTGITPGEGLGNRRKPLNKETLGIPVIAIGVPTVVDAATLVHDTMERLEEALRAQSAGNSPLLQMLMEEEDRYSLITELLTPYSGNLFVTPKEVDAVVERLAGILAGGLNTALHAGLTAEDIHRLTY